MLMFGLKVLSDFRLWAEKFRNLGRGRMSGTNIPWAEIQVNQNPYLFNESLIFFVSHRHSPHSTSTTIRSIMKEHNILPLLSNKTM